MLAAGRTIGEVCQALGISEATFQRWRNQYGGMKAEEAKRLKELEEENERLKKLLAEAELDKAILKRPWRETDESCTPAETVVRVRRSLGISERRACRVMGQPRQTQRYRPRTKEEERRLVERMLALVRSIRVTAIGGSGRCWCVRAGE